MTLRILTFLGILALPLSALADAGHIADRGDGHSHWLIYALLASAVFGIALTVRHARS